MTTGFFSPLPPAHTGVADYSASLLPALRRHGSVRVAPARCDVALYHLGNNQLHGAIYDRALAEPGIVVLHDALLHHFLLGRLDQAGYVAEFVYNYGEWSSSLARDLWRNRASSSTAGPYFEYPMLRRVVERSRAVIVHNPAAAAAVRRHAISTPVVEIPHLWEAHPAPASGAILQWRRAHGIPPAAFVFGVFGFLRESKRLAAVFDAFARLRRDAPLSHLLIAGEFVSSDLARAMAPRLQEAGITHVAYLREREFRTAVGAVDACINLRYPTAGETSGIAIRLMGLAKPVLLTEGLATSRYPEDACIRIPGGFAESDSLWHHMVLLTSMSDVARAIGLRGSGHVRIHHAVEIAAGQYWNTLCEYRG